MQDMDFHLRPGPEEVLRERRSQLGALEVAVTAVTPRHRQQRAKQIGLREQF